MHAIHVTSLHLIWQHRNAPTLSMTGNVVQVVRGRGHSSGMEQRANIKFWFKPGKLQQRLWNWWDKCTGIIVYLVHRYSGGMHDSKVVWKRFKMKPCLGVHFLFVTRESLQKWENEYKKNAVWLWEWWLMSLVLTEKIRQILVEDLGKRKVASRFVPHALSDDQRHEGVQYAKDIIKTTHRNKNFLNSIVAEDEPRCFRYDSTTERQSAEWKSPASPKGKKFIFKSQKWRQCLCVSTIARELITTSLSLRDKLSLEFFIWVLWNIYGRGFALSGPSTQHQAVGFFFTTMHRFTRQLL